jgi:hypothetical protein
MKSILPSLPAGCRICYLKKKSFFTRIQRYYQEKTKIAIPIDPKHETLHYIQHEDYVLIQSLGELISMNVEACTDKEFEKKRKEFAMGGIASWEVIKQEKVVKRDLEDILLPILYSTCNECESLEKFVINHTPGRGGTTFGRQILFKLSRKYPCIIVSPQASIPQRDDLKNLMKLLDPNKKLVPTCVLLCDNLADETVAALEEEADTLPIILIVLSRTQTDGKGKYILEPTLSARELRELKRLYYDICKDAKKLEEEWFKESEDLSKSEASFNLPVHNMPMDILFYGTLYFAGLDKKLADKFKKHLKRCPPAQQEAFALICMVFYYTEGTRALHKSELELIKMSQNFDDFLEMLILDNGTQIRPWHRVFAKELALALYPQNKRVDILERAILAAVKDAHLMHTLGEMLYKHKEGGDFSMLVSDLKDGSEKLLKAALSFNHTSSYVHYARKLA